MKSYLDEIYTVSAFKRDNPALAEQAEKALQYLKGHCLNSKEITFVIIVVEGYKCVAYLTNEFTPYEVSEMIVPFDKERIYPLQGLVTQYAFKRYN